MRHPLIIDGRNLLDPARVRSAGFAYEGIGRAVSPAGRAPGDARARARPARRSGSADPGGRQGRAPRRRGAGSSEAARSRRGQAARRVSGRAPRRRGRLARDRRLRRRLRGAVRGGARRASGPEIVAVGEPEPLGRGGGLRLAASQRQESGPLFALNGDELLGVDLGDLLERHRSRRPAATIVVSQVRSPFGVVDVDGSDTVTGFREAPVLPQWVSSGVYVLDDECIERLPERGDHEDTTFPELAAEGQDRRVPQHELLAHRQHAEAAARGRGVRARAPRARGGARVSTDSPNLLDLDALGRRRAARRQAVGLGADLGRDGPATSARCCSSARASR